MLITSEDDHLVGKYLRLPDLLCITFFLVCGGAFGIERIAIVPPLYAVLGILLIPWLYGFPMALITAELATAMPVQEGFVYWSSRAFGRMIGYLEGWLVVFVVTIDKALYPAILVGYIEMVTRPLGLWESFSVNVAFVSIGFLCVFFGPSFLGKITRLFALIVILSLCIFSVSCFVHSDVEVSRWVAVVDTNRNDLDDYQKYFTVLIWSFNGYDYSGFLAAEIANPESTYPRALISSLLINIIAYLVPLFAALSISPDLDCFSFIWIATHQLSPWTFYTTICGAVFSTLGVYVVYIHSSANSLAALSAKGDAPSIFSITSHHFQTPWVAIIFFSITTLLGTFFDFSFLVEVETVLYSIHTIILTGTFFKLRKSFPDMNRPFRVPGHILLLLSGAIFPVMIAIINIALLVSSLTFEVTIAILVICFILSTYYIVKFYAIYNN
uniref:Amino acid permease/ SLC12A domain-containing protein n=1 Tax=Arcella intermedia TaxID=1963864 RepID=A0A6B2L4B8_9EUKA